ncbi:hypothetical protein [Halobellus ordinarius]|uniref:hypothetical protein n=1 Tax=Halobellus ordinarius TaxID=3075120 RepID=UPI0028801144|nr:hypothetical protein [Halobellus sp. ZY16]
MASLLQTFGGGLLESVAQLAGILGTVVLGLFVLAMATYAYKQLRGGGVRWPDEETEDDDVVRGDSDDEWDYY